MKPNGRKGVPEQGRERRGFWQRLRAEASTAFGNRLCSGSKLWRLAMNAETQAALAAYWRRVLAIPNPRKSEGGRLACRA